MSALWILALAMLYTMAHVPARTSCLSQPRSVTPQALADTTVWAEIATVPVADTAMLNIDRAVAARLVVELLGRNGRLVKRCLDVRDVRGRTQHQLTFTDVAGGHYLLLVVHGRQRLVLPMEIIQR